MPNPLVVVRTYAVREFAASDHARLRAAGISAYVKGRDWPDRDVALVVDEAQVGRARAVLSEAPPILTERTIDDDPSLRCIYCGSSDVVPRRPYAAMALLLGPVAIAPLTLLGLYAAARVAGLLWVAGASAVFARAHRWHCHSCHRSY